MTDLGSGSTYMHPDDEALGIRPVQDWPEWDEHKTYLPIFATCVVPEDYLRALYAYAEYHDQDIWPVGADNDCATLEDKLRSIRPVTAAEPIQENFFDGWSAGQIFLCYKDLMVPPEADGWKVPEGRMQCTTFTMALIDQECLDPERPMIKILTDAPDQGDDLTGIMAPEAHEQSSSGPHEPRYPEPELRIIRNALAGAPDVWTQIEMLVGTWTEFAEGRELRVSLNPPAMFMSSPLAARRVKWRGLAVSEARRKSNKQAAS